MSTKKLYHYVYRITNIVVNKHYYGKRSSKLLPELDLGVRYFSSSSDREFIQDQKTNPQNYRYKIVSIYNSSAKALEKEIKLHHKFNVASSYKFYNKAIQTSTGFTMHGLCHSEKTKAKISAAHKGRTLSDETKAKISDANKGERHYLFGKIHSDKIKAKMSDVKKGEKNPMFGKVHPENTRARISDANKGKTLSENTKAKLSAAMKGIPRPSVAGLNHGQAKVANIYNSATNELIAANVSISEYCKTNGYNYGVLCSTARADRSLPHHSKTNRHCHKGIYARYI